MVEYIERLALLSSLCQANYPWADFNDAIEIVENIPAADVAEVVHGRFEMGNKRPKTYIRTCSVCRKDAYFCGVGCGYNYCPNCVAKMDLEGNNG